MKMNELENLAAKLAYCLVVVFLLLFCDMAKDTLNPSETRKWGKKQWDLSEYVRFWRMTTMMMVFVGVLLNLPRQYI